MSKTKKKNIVNPDQMVIADSIDNIDEVKDKKKITKIRKNVKHAFATFLFQISIENIIRYFNYGMFLPVKYLKEENRTADIQNSYPDYLVLTKHKYIDSKDRQYLIEIVLSTSEVNDLIETDNKDVFLYSKPIPISRVVCILYNESENIKDTLKTIEIGVDSYLVNSNKEIGDLEKIDNFNYKNNQEADNYNDKINVFDKLMGMFAFMKNAPLYYGNFSNYSDNYFKVLSIINKGLSDQLKINTKDEYIKFFKRIINRDNNKNDILSKIISIIYNKEENFNLEMLKSIVEEYGIEFLTDQSKQIKNELDTARRILLHPFLEYQKSSYVNEIVKTLLDVTMSILKQESIRKSQLDSDETKTIEELLTIATDSLEKINRFNLLKSNPLLTTYFYAAYIAEYGDKYSNAKHNLKNTITEEIPAKYAELLLALMGIYFGYFELPPQETINTESQFNELIQEPINIKFKLDSRLDYLTIESIYQFTFNNKIDENLDFLIAPESNNSPPDFSKFENDNGYKVKVEEYFDTKYYSVKKIDST